MTLDPVISATAGLFTGGLFLVACLHKMQDFARFRGTVRAYQIVADDMTGAIAVLAIAAELISGTLAIATGMSFQIVGLAGCVALLSLYAALILFSIARGNRAIDCGCLGFAARRPRLSRAMAVRNLALVMVAILAMFPIASRPLVWMDFTAMAGSLAMLALLYAGFDLAIGLPKREELI